MSIRKLVASMKQKFGEEVDEIRNKFKSEERFKNRYIVLEKKIFFRHFQGSEFCSLSKGVSSFDGLSYTRDVF